MTQLDEQDTAGRFWEPWKPQVGDRVRVTLNPECQREMPTWSTQYQIQRPYGHPPDVDGRTGVVVSPWVWSKCTERSVQAAESMGHPYWVRFDDDPTGRRLQGDNLAAAELELLERPS